jgi:tetratricopeptide (TPR) repeat protein
MSLCVLAAFSGPAAANWSDDPTRCDDANELEKTTAAWYNMCVGKNEPKLTARFLPSIDPRKLPDPLYSQVKAQCDSSVPNDADGARRCLIDMSLSYRAKAACGAEPTAPLSEELRTCMRNTSIDILLREEPTVRAICSSRTPGKRYIDCVDETYAVGPLAQQLRRKELAARLRKAQRESRSDDSADPPPSLPTGCAPGYGMKPTPGAFGAWSCQPARGVIFLTPGGKIAKNQDQSGFRNSAGGGPIRTDQAPPPELPAPSQPSVKISPPWWAQTNPPSAPRAGGGTGGPAQAPRAPAGVAGVSHNPQSDVTSTRGQHLIPSRPGGQDIRSYDSKQGAIVTGDGRKVSIKPMMAALEKVAPAAAKQPFVASPGGGLRLSPAAQRALVQNSSALRKVGGVELDVTFENLALLGVPEMRVTGPATLIENPVMISLRRLVAAAQPYADSPEHWRALPEDIRYPGALARVHGYVLDPSTKDVFIIGTAAGRPETRLDIDLMSVLMETVWAKGLTPGVSLDALPAFSRESDASSRLSPRERGRDGQDRGSDGTVIDWDTLHARIINLPSDALVSRIMLDADYEMKRVNYGLVKIADPNFENWSEIYKRNPTRAKGGSNRMWFHPIPLNPHTVRVSGSGHVVLHDAGVQLLAETTKAERGHLVGIGEVHPVDLRGAEEFTRAYRQIESSLAVKPRGVFALLHGITDIVTMCKILRESEIDYPVLNEVRRLPYRHLSGAEAVRSIYPALTVRYRGIDGTNLAVRGGVTLLSRPTRRSLDRFDDHVGTAFERAALDFQTDGFVRHLSLTFALASQQVGGSPAAELAKAAGKHLLAENQPVRASQRFREATTKDPVDIDAWIYLAWAEAQAGQHLPAREAIEQARAIDPNDSVVRKVAVQLARLATRDFVFDAVDPIQRRELSDEYAEKAFSALRRNDRSRAIENAELAIKWWPENPQPYIARGWIRNVNDQVDLAIQDYDQAIRLDPNYALAYNFRGDAYNNKSQYGRAIRDFDRAIELDPKYVTAFVNRGDAYRQKGEYDRALLDYNQAIELSPRYARAFNNRGLAHSKKDQTDLAIQDFNEALALNPEYRPAISNRADAFLAKHDYDRAIQDYDQAIRMAKNWWTFVRRGDAYDLKGDHSRAIADYDEAIRLDPKYGLTFIWRGEKYEKYGELDRAIQDYGEAIRIDRLWAKEGYEHRANAYLKQNDFDRAIQDYNQAAPRRGPDAIGFNNLGLAYLGKREYDSAIQNYTKAIELDPKFTNAFVNRGNAHRGKGDFDRAIADYTAAIRLTPKSAAAYANRGYSNFYRGDFPAAARDLLRANDLVDDVDSMLWRFLARSRMGQDGADELRANAERLKNKEWSQNVIDLLLGRRSLQEVRASAGKPEEKCKAEFYAGQLHLLRGAATESATALRAAADICPKGLIEYEGAVAELKRLNFSRGEQQTK